jgi:hypothetical protein
MLKQRRMRIKNLGVSRKIVTQMFRCYSRYALAVIITLEFGAIASPAQVLAQSSLPALSRSIPARWTPPNPVGAPDKREGAATRSGCFEETENPITALEPASILVSTIAPYPTLFWYWPYKPNASNSVSMKFELRDKAENVIYTQEIPVPSSPGIVSLDLSTLPKLSPLEIGNSYQWRLIPRCNRELLGVNSINGWVERSKSDPALVNKIQQATLEERVTLYANANLWYETLATLAELRRSNPNDPNLAEAWTKLLKSVDLDKIAAEPLIALPTTPTTSIPETPTATATPEQIQKLRERVQFIQNLNVRQVYLSTPSSSGGSPSGFGLNNSQGFLGVGIVERNRFDNKVDAGIAGGIGFGDARTAVGLEVVPTITNIINGNSSFPSGQVDFKVHRLLDRDTSIAVGVENLIQFGSTDAQSSTYGVISKIFRLRPSSSDSFSRLYTSIGIGGGRFRSVDDIKNSNDSINVFGGVGLRVAAPFSVYADYTGQDLNLGVSVLPFRDIPLVITPGVQDVFNNANDPDGGGRFSLSVGYSLSF